MNYQEAIAYLDSFINYERTPPATYTPEFFGLSRIEALMDRLGTPHLKVPTVHVAGTKGKGSTAAMVASVLSASGLKTGLYTSPHLISFRERFRIGERLISEQELAKETEHLKEIVEDVSYPQEKKPTYFDLITALSFLHFIDQQVDVAVIEVGLGGRLDSTNVIQPKVCAITEISYDHTDKLGSTLREIALEKAGIIKPGVSVVCGVDAPEAISAIQSVALQRNAPIYLVDEEIKVGGREIASRFQQFSTSGPWWSYDRLEIPLLGEHQLRNAATAVGVIEVLKRDGSFSIGEEHIRHGLKQVRWRGRLEWLGNGPYYLLDAAHNDSSARKIRRYLEQEVSCSRLMMILAILNDKDARAIMEPLCSLVDEVIVTKVSTTPRATPPEVLAEIGSEWCSTIEITQTVEEALEKASSKAPHDGVILITGSVYLVGEALSILEGEKSS